MRTLQERLERLKHQRDFICSQHKGHEQDYTYWGGYDLGYLEGKIAEIENMIDEEAKN